MTRISLPRRQAGLTLVELMISMAIGMIIVIAVVTAYISASRAARVAEATGRMNEDAQAALTILTLDDAGDTAAAAAMATLVVLTSAVVSAGFYWLGRQVRSPG